MPFSQDNPSVCYYSATAVDGGGFDYSNEECSRGYHFFCTLEEAKDY